MAFQERLLGLGGEALVERSTRVRQPQGEQERRPVGLQSDLRPTTGYVVAHRRVLQIGLAVLVDQPGQHPPRGVTLLARRGQILAQHRVDQRLERVQPRRPPRRGLALRRGRRAQRLAHHAPMPPIPAGELADPQSLAPLVTPDRLEQLHPRRPHPDPSRRGQAVRLPHRGRGLSARHDTPAVLDQRGAKSSRHTSARRTRGGAKSDRHNDRAQAQVGPDQTVTVGPNQGDKLILLVAGLPGG